MRVMTQDFFIEAMRPFMHELTITARSFDDKNKEYSLEQEKDYSLKIDYFNRESGTPENILTIYDLIIPARSEIAINFGISKTLIEFEKYPNDPSRGFNVMQMPVLYQKVAADGSAQPWNEIDSAGLLVQIPEPDFSMPFNVNSVSNALIAVLTINIFNVLVKGKRLLVIFE